MGRGTSGASKGGAKAKSKFTMVTDDYGRQVRVVPSIDDIPKSKDIWLSGGFSDDGKHYIVFADIDGYTVNPKTLYGIRASLDDLAATKKIAGWRSWKSSSEADTYIKKYDKPGSSRRTKRKVEDAKEFSKFMKKIGR